MKLLDYSTKPIDIISEEGEWISTYRYEPFLKKWFYIEPQMKGTVVLLDSEEVPNDVLNLSEKVIYEEQKAYYSPLKVQIQINKSCNYKCKMCYASSELQDEKYLNLDELDNLFKVLKSIGVIRVTLVGGEPFFRKDFIEVCNLVKKNRLLYTFITNGIIPGKQMNKYKDVIDNAFHLQVSCNGYGESYLKEYNAKNWEEAKDCITNVIKAAQHSTLSYVITKDNVNSISKFVKFANTIRPNIVKFGAVCFSGRAATEEIENAKLYYKNILPLACRIIEEMREMYPNLNIQSQLDRGNEIPSWETYLADYRPIELYFSPDGQDLFYINTVGDIFPFPLLANERFKVGNIKENILDLWRNSKVFGEIREANFKNSACYKLGCNKICGLWNRPYVYSWTKNLNSKIPCEMTHWE